MSDEFDHSTDIIPETHVIKETITDEIRPLIEQVRTTISALPPFAEPAIARLYDDATIMRFLRARALDVKKATDLISEDVHWRATYRPQDIRFSEVNFQATSGKMRVSPLRDRHGRPVVLIHSSYDTSAMKKDPDQQIRYLVWTLETAVRLLDDPVSKYTVVINLEGFSLFNSPASRVSKESAKCLSSRFPERLGTAVLLHAPLYFRVFYAIVSPFVDARTKSKIKFVKGDYAPGSESDAKLRDLIGDNWREITGYGGAQPDKTVSPGFDYAEFAAWVAEMEQQWFPDDTTAAAAAGELAAAVAADAAAADAAAAAPAEAGKQAPPSYDEATGPESEATAAVAVAEAEAEAETESATN